ncbi:MAG: hypothetical protein R6V03_09820 [Kiritimatiellia bacterium]
MSIPMPPRTMFDSDDIVPYVVFGLKFKLTEDWSLNSSAEHADEPIFSFGTRLSF